MTRSSITGTVRSARMLGPKIQKTGAPTVPLDNRNESEGFSARVATNTVATSPVYEIDLGKLALK